MKKALLFATVAMISLASCHKDRTCTCTTNQSDTAPGYTPPETITDVTTGKKVKKTDAALWCQSDVQTQSYKVGSSTYTHTDTKTCELK